LKHYASKYNPLRIVATIALLSLSHLALGQNSVDTNKTDSLKFKVEDRKNDKVTEGNSAQFDLKDPSNLESEIVWDPETNTFTVSEKIGKSEFRNPTFLTFDEFLKYQAEQDEDAYWKKRANTLFNLSKSGGVIPKVELGNAIFDRIFGGNGIEVKPQGNIDMFFGGNWQNIQNPAIVQSAQKYGIFDFQMDMNLNLLAKIGDKMKLNFNYNTRATLDFENQTKLEYTGQDDDIIKKLEAGNISFPLQSSLIQGVQSLWGVKAQLQFGRLMMTNVLSQQKSRKESFQIKGGAQTTDFEISSDDYDYFRHFLLGKYFRDNYNGAMAQYPIIQSLNNITRIEVWITNRSGITTNARDVVALQDLGEGQTFNPLFQNNPNALPDNSANSLHQSIVQTAGSRELGTTINALQSLGLKGNIDFAKTFARKLNPNEFNFNPQLGFISLNTQLQPDDVIGVAYEYTNNGKVYQVGEFSQTIPPDSNSPKVLFLKMLKSTTPDPTKPLWDLMMKNIYSLGASGVSPDRFILNLLYLDPGGGQKRFLPEGPNAGIPLLNLLNLDRLNNQGDPQPDGRFDYVDGITILPQQGKIIFPVLEPFGEDLKPALGFDPALEKKYLYNVLYDSTKNIAIQFPQFNRFLLKGSFQASNSSEIFLGGFNIPQGSVNVFAGGQKLIENVDYTIDYGIGKLKILNAGIMSSGIPINVSYENQVTFGTQVQSLIGTRLDYFISDDFTVGSTLMRLSERPYFNKVTFGDDPIRNSVVGLDANYQKELPGLTKLINKLPVIETQGESMLTASGEVARLFPGHSRFISDSANGDEGQVYIDDFEGTRSAYDLKFPVNLWSLSSAPQDATNDVGVELFPESKLVNDLDYGKNRANLAWYNVDPCLVDIRQTCMPAHLKEDTAQLSDHRIRLVQQQEVFPNRTFTTLQGNLSTFDLAYIPTQRGPYNYDATNIDSDGNLLNPQDRWAGIMRPIDISDFETSNVEFIEFWIMDPFTEDPNSAGGDLYLNMGNISEDILKDSRKFYENGMPFPKDPNKLTTTEWGNIPKFQQQITRAFENDNNARSVQDIGYDGMDDDEEKTHLTDFLTDLSNAGVTPQAYQRAEQDPANDNFQHFRDEIYTNSSTSVINRYMRWNGSQGNSPVGSGNEQFSNSATNIPESEDINRDNTLNENEQYFEYKIRLTPNMQVGQNFIVNEQVSEVTLANDDKENIKWYQFKIPIRKFTNKVGGISDFRSIRFFRMFLTGFQDTTVLRFARLELGRNQWRRYNFSLKNPGEMIPLDDNDATTFNLSSVSLEENGSRSPVPYVIPPGIERQLTQGTNGQNVFLNEQALSLQVCQLEDGDSRGVFKSLGMDMRQFGRLKMFMHAEPIDVNAIKDGDLRGFIRLGSDFANNYYEYAVPLKLSLSGSSTPEEVWPVENNIDLAFDDLIQAKLARNKQGYPKHIPFTTTDSKGNFITILGDPNIGDAKMAMLGVLNPQKTPNTPLDDGANKCAEVWFNELRLSNLQEEGGYAAMGQANLQLADIATVKMSGNMYTAGYGNIDQRVNDRSRENFSQFDVSTNVNAGRLLPKDWNVQLPVFAGYSETVSNPVFDPYDKDVKLEDQLANYQGTARDSVRQAAQTFTAIKSLNFQNVRIAPKNNKKLQPWDFQNFDASYSLTKTENRNPLLEKDNLDEHNLSLGYSFAPKSKPIEPFKKMISAKRKYLRLIKDFNFNPVPANFTFRTGINRIIGETAIRNIDDGNYTLPVNYFKFFTWDRSYNLRWNLTRSLSFDYGANNFARVDEPFGRIDNESKRDTLLKNLSKFGRTTNFNHKLNATYNVPTKKFPLLDWTNIRATYNSTYDFNRNSLLATYLGNTVSNSQRRQVNGDLNFTQLYNKVKILRAINTPSRGGKKKKKATKKPLEVEGGSKEKTAKFGRKKDKEKGDSPTKDGKVEKKDGEEIVIKDGKIKIVQSDKGDINREAEKKRLEIKKIKEEEAKKRAALVKKKAKEARKKRMPDPSEGVRIVGKALMMLKRVSVNFNEDMGTILPGYLDSTQFFGMNWGNQMRPGIPFVAGYQPDRNWFETAGQNNWLTRDSIFNAQLSQRYSQTLNITANVEPFKDFRIDFTLKKSFNKNLQELFKDTVGGGSDFVHLNPFEAGSFDVSYVSFQTLFQKRGVGGLTQAFGDFEDNRKVISKRLGILNPYTSGLAAPEDPEYAKGYTRYAQNVLIPAFLSAYTGRSAESFPLISNDNATVRSNPFRHIMPLPNWRINYNGLSRNKKLKKYFKSFTLTHAYNGSLSMNGFNSALAYNDAFGLSYPSFLDSTSGNYIPYFFVPNITMTETFGPIVGIDATLQNSLNLHFEWKKSRTLSMSLIDFQLSETTSSEFSIGGGIRLKNVVINTQYFNLHNQPSDMNIRFDFSIRDDLTSISRLDQQINLPTRGQKVISIAPSIDYLLNKNLTVRLLYDRRQSIPYVNNAFPITTTRGGVMLRFLLGE